MVQLPRIALFFRKESKGMVEAEAWAPLFFQLSLLSNCFLRQGKIIHKINQSHTAISQFLLVSRKAVCP